jgi:hypothetical protein
LLVAVYYFILIQPWLVKVVSEWPGRPMLESILKRGALERLRIKCESMVPGLLDSSKPRVSQFLQERDLGDEIGKTPLL